METCAPCCFLLTFLLWCSLGGKFDVFCRTISWQLSLVKNIRVRIGVRFQFYCGDQFYCLKKLGVPRENDQPAANDWKILSYKVVLSESLLSIFTCIQFFNLLYRCCLLICVTIVTGNQEFYFHMGYFVKCKILWFFF